MGKITLDSTLRDKLNGLREQLEVCDESGQTVGHFVPRDIYDELFYARLSAISGDSPAELRRIHQETGGMTLAEFWKLQEKA